MAGSKGSKYYNVFLRYKLDLVDVDGTEVIGQEGFDLLMNIREAGSIISAARKMGVSYRKAWGIIREMEEWFMFPMVVKQRGGAEGGMTTLSPEGNDLLDGYLELRSQFDISINEITRKFFRKINTRDDV